MARIRTIKPEFWTSEQVVECSTNARLMFIGLMNFVDDSGVHPAKPMRIKMQVFPGDAFSASEIGGFIGELESAGLVRCYEVGGEDYLQITGFTKHQRIDQPSYKFPLPNGKVPDNPKRRRSESSEDGSVQSGECSTNNSGTGEERSPPEGNGRECNGREGSVGEKDSGADKPRKPKRATQLPDDFQPNDSNRKVAAEQGVSIAEQLPQFRDHHMARGSTMKDWHAALNTWLRNAKKFDRGRPGGQKAETPQERARRMAAERGIPHDPR